MKKLKSKIWKLSLVLAIVGLIAFLTSLICGAQSSTIYINANGFHLQTNEILETSVYNLEKFENIEIDIYNSDIEIISSDKFRIEILANNNLDAIHHRVENNTLYLDQDREGKMYFKLFSVTFDFYEEVKNKIRIYVVDNDLHTIDIKVNKGDIAAADLNLEKMSLSIESGDVQVTNINTKILDLDCESGDVDIENITSDYVLMSNHSGDYDVNNLKADRVELLTHHGDIEIQNLEAKFCEFITHYGDVEIENITNTSTLYTKSYDGDIDIKGIIRGNNTIVTRNGTVDIEIQGTETSYNYNLETYLGDVFVDNVEVGNTSVQRNYLFNELEIETYVGSIFVEFVK